MRLVRFSAAFGMLFYGSPGTADSRPLMQCGTEDGPLRAVQETLLKQSLRQCERHAYEKTTWTAARCRCGGGRDSEGRGKEMGRNQGSLRFSARAQRPSAERVRRTGRDSVAFPVDHRLRA